MSVRPFTAFQTNLPAKESCKQTEAKAEQRWAASLHRPGPGLCVLSFPDKSAKGSPRSILNLVRQPL